MKTDSTTYLKNKIIFKSILEKISPIDRVWDIKKSIFDIKNLFEEQKEKRFYDILNNFITSQSFMDYENNNYYNLLTLEIEKVSDSKKEMSDLIDYLDEIRGIKISEEEIPLIKRNIEFYVKAVATYYAFENSINMYEKSKGKNYQEAENMFYSIFQTMESAIKINISSGDFLGWDFSSLDEDTLKLAFEEKVRIPFSSNFPTLQDITSGGIPLKTINAILGSTHVGKTRMLLNLAMDYFLNGINVAYVTLEISQEDILGRAMSHILHKSIKEISTKPSKQIYQLYKNFKQKHTGTGKLYIKEFPTSEFTPRDFEQYVDSFKNKDPEDRPQVFIVDYLQIMGTMSNNVQGSYFSLKENIEKLRGVAQKNDIVIWTAGQLKRNSHNKIGNDVNDVSESWAIIATADFVSIIEENDAFKQYGVQIMRVRKNRNGKPFDLPIFLELEDSWLFNLKELQDSNDLDRYTQMYEKMSNTNKFDF